MRKLHNIEFLYTHCELRGLMMGSKFQDAPLITSIDELAGTKNRVTGTQLGRLAMELMNLNPVPIAWEETLDGLKQGLIDGAETWMGAAAYANMSPVLSQAVDLRFFCGTEHTAMNHKTFASLDPELQDIIKETSFEAQQYTQIANEKALIEVTGAVENPPAGTVFGDAGVRFAPLSDAERRKAEEMCSPEFQPEKWEKWIDRIGKMGGGQDVYKGIYDIAREIPIDMDAVDVTPVRWWEA
jgi:TRAP-type C4-dicarboxylate transport system substrate-binding protein